MRGREHWVHIPYRRSRRPTHERQRQQRHTNPNTHNPVVGPPQHQEPPRILNQAHHDHLTSLLLTFLWKSLTLFFPRFALCRFVRFTRFLPARLFFGLIFFGFAFGLADVAPGTCTTLPAPTNVALAGD